MPKISLERDEWYPVYVIVTDPADYEPVVEVDDATIMRWTAILEGFTKMQKEMAELYKRANGGDE